MLLFICSRPCHPRIQHLIWCLVPFAPQKHWNITSDAFLWRLFKDFLLMHPLSMSRHQKHPWTWAMNSKSDRQKKRTKVWSNFTLIHFSPSLSVLRQTVTVVSVTLFCLKVLYIHSFSKRVLVLSWLMQTTLVCLVWHELLDWEVPPFSLKAPLFTVALDGTHLICDALQIHKSFLSRLCS